MTSITDSDYREIPEELQREIFSWLPDLLERNNLRVNHMGTIREEDVHDGVKKKSKKRKNKESITLIEERGNIKAREKGYKKVRTEFLGDADANASEAVGDVNSDIGVGRSPENEKKMHDGSIIDGKDQGNDKKRKRKKEKCKIGDVGEASSVLEASEEKIHGESDSRVFSEQQTQKEKIHAEEFKVIDREAKKDKKKNIKADGEVSIGFELVKEGEEQAGEGGQVKKNKKKKKIDKLNRKEADCVGENDNAGLNENQIDNEVIQKVDPSEDKKKKKEKRKKDKALLNESHMHSICSGEDKEGQGSFTEGDSNASPETNDKVIEKVETGKDKEKKKKDDPKKPVGSNTKEAANAGALETNNMNAVAEPSNRFTSRKKMKKVTFSGQDEYISLPDNSRKGKKKLDDDGKGNKSPDDGLIRGKRFSKEEDEVVEKAVLDYIEERQLGENGLEMVLKCKSYPEVKDCWKEIGKALPHRPYMSVYYRAHILFERSDSRKWTPEELELVQKFHEKHGADWKTLAEELGKHRFHVKDAWRRIRLPNRKKGNWSQDEYQSLFDLVNLDLSMKVYQEKKLKYGMLRDNISWEAISEKLSTRTNSVCCMKWYNQLSSPLVGEGKWANTDDYRLLMALTELDAACEEDVDWDELLEHRSGEVCRQRWHQMVRHIGQYGTKPFTEQVEILSQRYCPDMLEAREAYDNAPVVD